MYISPAPPESFAFDPECLILNKACKGDGCLKETVNRCSKSLNDSYSPPYHCYVVWKNTTEGVSIELRGCVSGKDFTCGKTCIERDRSPKNGHFFCCCSTDLCNENFLHLPAEEVNKIELAPTRQTTTSNFDSDLFWITIYILVPSIIILGIILILSWYQRNKSRAFNEDLSNSDESTPINEQSFYRFKNLELDGEQSRGRFGAVWRARLPNENGFLDEKWVAVKIFPAHEKNSWLTEQQVFMLPKFEHKNILPFLGVDKREDDNVPFGIEYWIISEFHELGSLYDYLKSNTIEFSDFLKISEGIACGLVHLHDEIPSTKAGQTKPAIAHRDFKSKNVLLKSDLTPRIADFGLCLIFYPDRAPTDLGQVGTRRYMAPEVLEGAINFYRDAFTRIDIYAFGLVLWELIFRCKGEDGTIIPDKYVLPFEEEVGLNPTLEDMQKIVCQMKKRPEIKPIWRSYPASSQMCETIEECWDQDAEARLSASCVFERVSSLKKAETPTVDDQ